jgi:hypothetical protein
MAQVHGEEAKKILDAKMLEYATGSEKFRSLLNADPAFQAFQKRLAEDRDLKEPYDKEAAEAYDREELELKESIEKDLDENGLSPLPVTLDSDSVEYPYDIEEAGKTASKMHKIPMDL